VAAACGTGDRSAPTGLPAYSDWPTFPQLFIDEELIGGCDIVLELFEQGELQTMLEQHGKVEEQPQE